MAVGEIFRGQPVCHQEQRRRIHERNHGTVQATLSGTWRGWRGQYKGEGKGLNAPSQFFEGFVYALPYYIQATNGNSQRLWEVK